MAGCVPGTLAICSSVRCSSLGSFAYLSTCCMTSSAFGAGVYRQGFLETGEELSFRASYREVQGLKAKLQDLA